jgi:hypothetical protein
MVSSPAELFRERSDGETIPASAKPRFRRQSTDLLHHEMKRRFNFSLVEKRRLAKPWASNRHGGGSD